MPKLPKPPGHHTITPGFAVPNATRVLEFLQKAFGAKLVDKYDAPDGSIAHCEIMIGDSVVMFGEANPTHGMEAMPASLSYYVDDGAAVDATYKRAVASGAKSMMEPKDQFYGYRSATVKDPGGNKWTICAIVEQLTPEEMRKRADTMMKGAK
jgi:PhnB protein